MRILRKKTDQPSNLHHTNLQAIDELDEEIIRLKLDQNNINGNITLVVQEAKNALDIANKTFKQLLTIKARIEFPNEVKLVR